MRLIDADALKRHYSWWKGGTRSMTMDEAKADFDVIIDLQPTIEAEPVKHGAITLTYEEYGELCSYALADEQKHGEWFIDKSGSLMCSKCGTLLDEFQKPSRFCPNCGADMREVKRND